MQSDYDRWGTSQLPLLDDSALLAAEDRLRADKAADAIGEIAFDASKLPKLLEFVRTICAESLSDVALAEIEQHPDMLVWIKTGHEYHDRAALEACLFCGNKISAERRSVLAASLDDRIDTFIAKIDATIVRFQANLQELELVEQTAPA